MVWYVAIYETEDAGDAVMLFSNLPNKEVATHLRDNTHPAQVQTDCNSSSEYVTWICKSVPELIAYTL